MMFYVGCWVLDVDYSFFPPTQSERDGLQSGLKIKKEKIVVAHTLVSM